MSVLCLDLGSEQLADNEEIPSRSDSGSLNRQGQGQGRSIFDSPHRLTDGFFRLLDTRSSGWDIQRARTLTSLSRICSRQYSMFST